MRGQLKTVPLVRREPVPQGRGDSEHDAAAVSYPERILATIGLEATVRDPLETSAGFPDYCSVFSRTSKHTRATW